MSSETTLKRDPSDSSDPAAGPGLPALLVDSTAGKLCRWLRLLGLDAAYHPGLDMSELFRRARREGRRVVSRSSKVQRWAPEEVIHLTSERVEDQLREVVRALGGPEVALRPLTRCSLCNQPVRSLPREEAKDLVPPFVWQSGRSFGQCPCCGRVYWEATHCRGIRARLEELAP